MFIYHFLFVCFSYLITTLLKCLSIISYLYVLATLLQRYLDGYRFTELHLDGIFKYGDNNTLPSEVSCSPT